MNSNRAQAPFRWGILGTGWMASVFTEELRCHPEAVVVGVASTNRERAGTFAREHHIPRWHDTYEALVAETDLDIVYDATTNNFHLENALNCLMSKKPVLVEKPICLSPTDLDQLIEVHREQGTFCMEAMWTRFFPLIRSLEVPLSAISPLESMVAEFGIHIPFDPTHRIYAPALGGGALYDLGVYPLNLAHLLFGFAECEMSSLVERAETGVDETATIHLSYTNGVSARLFCSASKATPHRAVFTGARGTVVLEDFFHPSKLAITTDAETVVQVPEYPHMGYNYEIDEVHRAVSAGDSESGVMPLSASREILEIIDRVLNPR